jgi:hypothetical protein
MKRQYEDEDEENTSADIRGERRIIVKKVKTTHIPDATLHTRPVIPVAAPAITRQNPPESKPPLAQQPQQNALIKSSLAILHPIIDILEMDKTSINSIYQIMSALPLARLSTDQLHGIIVYAHITSKSTSEKIEPSEFIQFACKLFTEFKNIHYPKAEKYSVFPPFMGGCLQLTFQILQMTKYSKLNEVQQLFVTCMDTIKASCSLYFEFQKMFIILVNDTLDTKDKGESLFNRHLYKYSWMLVIFVIG